MLGSICIRPYIVRYFSIVFAHICTFNNGFTHAPFESKTCSRGKIRNLGIAINICVIGNCSIIGKRGRVRHKAVGGAQCSNREREIPGGIINMTGTCNAGILGCRGPIVLNTLHVLIGNDKLRTQSYSDRVFVRSKLDISCRISLCAPVNIRNCHTIVRLSCIPVLNDRSDIPSKPSAFGCIVCYRYNAKIRITVEIIVTLGRTCNVLVPSQGVIPVSCNLESSHVRIIGSFGDSQNSQREISIGDISIIGECRKCAGFPIKLSCITGVHIFKIIRIGVYRIGIDICISYSRTGRNINRRVDRNRKGSIICVHPSGINAYSKSVSLVTGGLKRIHREGRICILPIGIIDNRRGNIVNHFFRIRVEN